MLDDTVGKAEAIFTQLAILERLAQKGLEWHTAGDSNGRLLLPVLYSHLELDSERP
jgi:hypothetical protein